MNSPYYCRYEYLDKDRQLIHQNTNTACFASFSQDTNEANKKGNVKYVQYILRSARVRACPNLDLWIRRFHSWYENDKRILETVDEIRDTMRITIDATKNIPFEAFLVFNLFRHLDEHSSTLQVIQSKVIANGIKEPLVFNEFVRTYLYAGYGVSGHSIFIRAYGYTSRTNAEKGYIFQPILEKKPVQPFISDKSDGRKHYDFQCGEDRGFSAFLHAHTSLIAPKKVKEDEVITA